MIKTWKLLKRRLMSSKAILTLILVVQPIYLYFFQTQAIWKNRNYVTWTFILLLFASFIYFLSPLADKKLMLILLIPSFIWLTLSFVFDRVFIFKSRKEFQRNTQATYQYPNHLIFTFFDKVLALKSSTNLIKMARGLLTIFFQTAYLYWFT